jgi:type IV pilus assembly protein PilA
MLARLRKRIDEKEEGFTLIELLVVIIIIGILAAIAIPVFLSQKSKGYEASLKSDLRTVAENIESMNVDTQDYTKVLFGAASATLATSGTAITGTSQTVGNDSVNLSAGNTVKNVLTSTAGFCISATSSKASPAVTLYYNSQSGGLLPKTATSCAG